jgi:Fe-S-cluster containining protein
MSARTIATPSSKKKSLAAKPPAKRLPLVQEQEQEPEREQVPCLSCGLCCSYIAVEIDGPDNLRAATDILWYLYHGGVCIYVDDDGWMVQIDTVCRYLQDDKKCAVYENRPQICRAYDEKTCEVNADLLGETFYTAAEYLTYLQKNHKRMYGLIAKRYMPNGELLNAPPNKKRPGPFAPRFAAVRALGVRR